jgi:acyl-CoA dehydrogenase
MIGLFRTSPPTKENRRHGLTSFLVDMKNTPGITCKPIRQMSGEREFNEVHLPGCLHSRTATCSAKSTAPGSRRPPNSPTNAQDPERFLETYYVLTELVRALGPEPDARSAEGVGRLVAQLHTHAPHVRVGRGHAGGRQGARRSKSSIVKDLGTLWEQALPVARCGTLAAFIDAGARQSSPPLAESASPMRTKVAPKLTIQGGTTEVLRGIIARGLGLR